MSMVPTYQHINFVNSGNGHVQGVFKLLCWCYRTVDIELGQFVAFRRNSQQPRSRLFEWFHDLGPDRSRTIVDLLEHYF